MNILLDIGHPAHVHLLKNTYFQLVQDGHNVWVTVRDIPLAMHLLEVNGIPFRVIGRRRDSILRKAFIQIGLDREILHFVRSHKIEVGVGSSMALSHVSKLTNMKSIILDDDDDAVEPLFVKYAHPFADVILSPDCVKRKSLQTIGYPGYHDLAYLHPNVFKPSPDVLKKASLTQGEPFFILRFNAFKAHHDIGESGLSLEEKRRLVNFLSLRGKVLITAERDLEPEFQPYAITVPPEQIHSLMYYATMFIGDSQSMTSEAAVLGTPALKCNTFAGRLAVPNELENRYGLCFSFLPSQFDLMFDKMQQLLAMPNLKAEWQRRVETMLKDKTDVTQFFVHYIEHVACLKSKNVLIDVGHPAHVHMFKQVARRLMDDGHNVLFTCRTKEFAVDLLEAYGFRYRLLGKKSNSVLGKVRDTLLFEWKEWLIARRFHADVLVSHGSIVSAHVAYLMRKPHISFEDTFNMEQVRLYAPFTDVIITADYPHPLTGRANVLPCACYNELLYLHPNHFHPDSRVLRDLGLRDGEPFTIVRFVGWNATHDMGRNGFSEENKVRAVKAFEQYGRVFISSENPLPKELELYHFPLLPARMHEAEAFASLVFGESATMASEAAVLGVPGIYLDNTGRLYTAEQEAKYHLCFCFTESETDQRRAIEKGVEILSGKSGIDFKAQQQLLLADKIDVTAFFTWFIENYPQSLEIVKNNPEYQYRFR